MFEGCHITQNPFRCAPKPRRRVPAAAAAAERDTEALGDTATVGLVEPFISFGWFLVVVGADRSSTLPVLRHGGPVCRANNGAAALIRRGPDIPEVRVIGAGLVFERQVSHADHYW